MDLEKQAALLTEQLTALILPVVLGVNVAVVVTALYGVMVRLTTFAHPELSEDEAGRKIAQLVSSNRLRRTS